MKQYTKRPGNEKLWIVPHRDSDKIEALSRDMHISPVTAALLLNRGFNEAGKAREFINPSLHQLRDPVKDENVRAAAQFLKDCIGRGKKITIYGDFDADGICATALMVRALRAAGANVDFYVPHRFDEGYGLNVSALKEIKGRGTDVLITVDCGINACEEIKYARATGLEVIITDHHQPRGNRMPDAPFLLNPHISESCFGYKNLSGVGVAFKLAWALGQIFGSGAAVSSEFKDVLVDLLPLVAIGTVADIVPMEDENRIYVNYGLRLLPSAGLPGLQAIMGTCGILGRSGLTTYHIGYQLAPRLNAVGRISDAEIAIEMLITDDEKKAQRIAQELETHNRNRQRIQRTISEEAMAMAVSSHDMDSCSCIVLSSPEWHPGVVGLAASRLAENFSRPAFVFCEENGIARGSARGIEGVDLFKAVSQCSDILHRFGGHRGAAGLTLPVENMELFKRHISGITRDMMGSDIPLPKLHLECEIELNKLSVPLVNELAYLEPYGEGNPQPLLFARGLKLAGNPQLVGARRDHLAFLAKQGGAARRVIAFGKAEWIEKINSRRKEPFSLAFEPRINTFNNSCDIELRAEDIQWEDEDRICFLQSGNNPGKVPA